MNELPTSARRMDRRQFLKAAAALPILTSCSEGPPASGSDPSYRVRRVRPGDPAWPSEASWKSLRSQVAGRLFRVESPLAACERGGADSSCAEVLARVENPFFLGDEPALTQTSGWLGAWTSQPSIYAVAATETADVVAAVNFAREHNLRLVVKGGGHSYQGTSCAPDSLLIWTRAMNDVVLHDAFVPQDCAGSIDAQPAVSVGAGAMWLHVYDAVTTGAGRYVQGGGCTTVGVAGLIQGGGFGSFSKRYGLASAGLLEAEVVTADGAVRIANPCTNPDLFWALKGGGGGSFGVVTRLTLRTRELPAQFGGVFGTIQARTDAAFLRLLDRITRFYRDELLNPHWGEQIRLRPDNTITIQMLFQGLPEEEARDVWRLLIDWVAQSPEDFSWQAPILVVAVPARHFWDAGFLKQHAPGFTFTDDRPGAAEANFAWAGDIAEAGQFLYGYRSTWLPALLLAEDQRHELVNALFAASRRWEVSLHFNKGLAGAPASERAAAADTPMNPVVLDAFALAIIAGGGSSLYRLVPGSRPDLATARQRARSIGQAMGELLKVVTTPGSYVSETDYFERDWQRSFWGDNCRRLATIKGAYDPEGLFFVHHGVGSEDWDPDGFSRVSHR